MRPTPESDTRRFVHGVEYSAVTAPRGLCYNVDGAKCAAYRDSASPVSVSCRDFECMAYDRADRTAVIWVKAAP